MGKLTQGNQMVVARDYDGAIAVLYAALELDTQSAELNAQLDTALTAAEVGMAAQEEARAAAGVLIDAAEVAITGHDYAGAINAYETAAVLDVNDEDMTRYYEESADAGAIPIEES